MHRRIEELSAGGSSDSAPMQRKVASPPALRIHVTWLLIEPAISLSRK